MTREEMKDMVATLDDKQLSQLLATVNAESLNRTFKRLSETLADNDDTQDIAKKRKDDKDRPSLLSNLESRLNKLEKRIECIENVLSW